MDNALLLEITQKLDRIERKLEKYDAELSIITQPGRNTVDVKTKGKLPKLEREPINSIPNIKKNASFGGSEAYLGISRDDIHKLEDQVANSFTNISPTVAPAKKETIESTVQSTDVEMVSKVKTSAPTVTSHVDIKKDNGKVSPEDINPSQKWSFAPSSNGSVLIDPNSLGSQVWVSFFGIVQFILIFIYPTGAMFSDCRVILIPASILNMILCFVDAVLISNTAIIVGKESVYGRERVFQILLRSGRYYCYILGGFPYPLILSALEYSIQSSIWIICLANVAPFLVAILDSFRIGILSEIAAKCIRTFHINVAATSGIKIMICMIIYWHWNACFVNFFREINLVPDYRPQYSIIDKYIVNIFSSASEMLSAGWAADAPQVSIDRIFKIFNIVFSALLNAVFVGNIASFMIGLDSSGRQFNEKVDQVTQYINYKGFPKELGRRILDYYHFKYSRSKFFDEETIYNELSIALRQSISLVECETLINNVPFFKQAEKTFISQLVMSMKLEHFLKDDDIMIEGSVGEEMYFISTGNVSVYIGGQHKAVLHTGQFFGEISLLMGKMKRTATIRANENCKLYSLSRVDVEKVMAGYPITMANIKKIAQERLNAANQARRESKINGL